MFDKILSNSDTEELGARVDGIELEFGNPNAACYSAEIEKLEMPSGTTTPVMNPNTRVHAKAMEREKNWMTRACFFVLLLIGASNRLSPDIFTGINPTSSTKPWLLYTKNLEKPCDYTWLGVDQGEWDGGLAVDQGNDDAMIDPLRLPKGIDPETCKAECDHNASCRSISFCGKRDGCWFKTREFNGGEPFIRGSDCKTLFKKPSYCKADSRIRSVKRDQGLYLERITGPPYANSGLETDAVKTATADGEGIWTQYRLGDAVLQSLSKYLPHGSIAEQYVALCKRKGWKYQGWRPHHKNGWYHKNDFCRIVAERGTSIELPRAGDLVVHLRLGDVLDGIEEIDDVWEYGLSIVPLQIRTMHSKRSTGWWHYVRSKCYYRALLAELPPAKTINHVILIGSDAHRAHAEDSKDSHSAEWMNLVEAFFKAQGFSVAVRSTALPDDDMVFMSHASAFVSSGGGFSTLAQDCVKELGGVVLGGEQIQKACAAQPRPNIALRDYSWETWGWYAARPPGTGVWKGARTYPGENCTSGWEPTCTNLGTRQT